MHVFGAIRDLSGLRHSLAARLFNQEILSELLTKDMTKCIKIC